MTEQALDHLVRRANHPVWYRAARAAAFLSAGAVLAVSPEARAAFTGWVREVYETSFIYRFFGTDPETSARVLYRPAHVPAGFQMGKEM